ncbi:MAG: hypothetical protein SF052_10735 [Bacteroidia bacterium]|nr:hypothetical protein [Bacteroidia bacterium]
MTKKRFFSRFPLIFLLLLSLGCGEIRPVWKGEIKLANYELFYSEPCEFQVNVPQIKDSLNVMLELVVTYYVGITRNNLPLFIVLEDQQHNVTEFTTNVVLKEEGEWLGMPEENEIDYTLTHVAIPEFNLNPGSYVLRLYANDDSEEKVYGVVNIEARIFEVEAEPTPGL